MALSFGLVVPAFATAQTGTTSGGASQTATTADRMGTPDATGMTGETGTTGTSGEAGTTGQPTGGTSMSEPGASHWIASGFVGTNFGASSNGATVDFGGSVGYLWRGWVGGEFLASFNPKFEVQNIVLFAGERPQVNTYMVNAIGAVPLGADGQWQPFVSGGFGAVDLRSDSLIDAAGTSFQPKDTRPGGNIGAGVLAYLGNWGVRGDVRYFRAFEDNNIATAATPGNAIGKAVLSGLDFWRANVGLAVRW
jgi:hypothetical protein